MIFGIDEGGRVEIKVDPILNTTAFDSRFARAPGRVVGPWRADLELICVTRSRSHYCEWGA
jgi:ribosomal protein L21E